ncbi:MAG: primosomal protein N' [Endomicrobiales bacterium]|nr:primosomal protein N' [Endomicrobiales bacterium]
MQKIAEVALSIPLNKTFHYTIPEEFLTQASIGAKVEVQFGNKKLVGFIVGFAAQSNIDKLKPITNVLNANFALSAELLALSKRISGMYFCSIGEALNAVASSSIKAPKRNPVEKQKIINKICNKPQLTTNQLKAFEQITNALKAQKSEVFLLHGVTGSGKTEVYLTAIEEAIKLGKSAILLVPEISLTAQFADIFLSRFSDSLGLWHSKITQGEKFRLWAGIREGKIKVLLGARSAVFAPFSNLGLIIVDEEHESTYKQDNKPAYNAKEIALERSALNRCVIIFGSATPSIESYHRALNGQFKLLELPQRIDNKPLPPVELLDLRQNPIKNRVITPVLHKALTQTLARREQAIVFLNRRGHSPVIMCHTCGQTLQCPNCAISLVYFKGPERLQCNYCGYTQECPNKCPHCSGNEISVFGVGTQKAQEEVQKLFPFAKIFRLDKDTTSKKDTFSFAYKDFKDENYDILLGTQLVAKGFDFPRVTLVGVVSADTALCLPDFRSAERTFQLITQVAGRTGRGLLGGQVIVQTMHPEHYALRCAKEHDYKKFYETEIAFRKQLNYPPFCNLVNLNFKGLDESKVSCACAMVHKTLCEIGLEKYKVEAIGPSVAARPKLYGQYRWQIMLKGNKAQLFEVLKELFLKGFKFSGVKIAVDIDPIDVL